MTVVEAADVSVAGEGWLSGRDAATDTDVFEAGAGFLATRSGEDGGDHVVEDGLPGQAVDPVEEEGEEGDAEAGHEAGGNAAATRS